MDWKTVGNYVLLIGMFVGMVTMFNQVNTRIDSLQAETSRRFDMLQGEMNQTRTESNRRFDEAQAEVNRRFDAMQGEINQMRAENNRRFDRVDQRFDQIFEALRVFEGRVTRLEEKAGIGPDAE